MKNVENITSDIDSSIMNIQSTTELIFYDNEWFYLLGKIEMQLFFRYKTSATYILWWPYSKVASCHLQVGQTSRFFPYDSIPMKVSCMSSQLFEWLSDWVCVCVCVCEYQCLSLFSDRIELGPI